MRDVTRQSVLMGTGLAVLLVMSILLLILTTTILDSLREAAKSRQEIRTVIEAQKRTTDRFECVLFIQPRDAQGNEYRTYERADQICGKK